MKVAARATMLLWLITSCVLIVAALATHQRGLMMAARIVTGVLVVISSLACALRINLARYR